MKKYFQYAYLSILNNLSKSELERVQEPSAITDQAAFVDDYNKAVNSQMVLPYAIAMNTVYRAMGQKVPKRALDLCCGPGHFTGFLATYFGCEKVKGVDLSDAMLHRARENAVSAGLSQVAEFQKGDVTNLDHCDSKSFDVVTFMNGAHHLNSLADVTQVLMEAERVATSEGLIMVMDPVRQKTDKITKLYHQVAGRSYLDQGLAHFNEDFHSSICASWSPEELISAVPKNSQRKWVQLTPFGLPTFQIILGLPVGREQVFIREPLSQEVLNSMIPKNLKAEWQMLKLSFNLASKKVIQSQCSRNGVPK